MKPQSIEIIDVNGDNDEPRQVAGYIRVNINEETDSGTLEVQEKAIQDFCHKRGWELRDLYVDEVCSAEGEDPENLPEYLRMMADVKKERFDILVTYSIDRMSRSILNMFRTLKTFEECDVSFVAIREDLDFSGPVGTVLMALFASLAEMQSTNISHNAEEGTI